jgi:hypothetical protein
MPYLTYSPETPVGIYRADPVRFTCTLVGSKDGIKNNVQIYLASTQTRMGNGAGFCYIDPDDRHVYLLTALIGKDASGNPNAIGFNTYDSNNEQINKVAMTPEFTLMDMLKFSINYDTAIAEYGLKDPVFDPDAPIANIDTKPPVFYDNFSTAQTGGRKRKTRRTKKHKRS